MKRPTVGWWMLACSLIFTGSGCGTGDSQNAAAGGTDATGGKAAGGASGPGSGGASSLLAADAGGVWVEGTTLTRYTGTVPAIAGSLDGVAVADSTSLYRPLVGTTIITARISNTVDMRVWVLAGPVADQPTAITGGLLMLESPLPHAGEYLCIDEGQALRSSDGSIALALQSLSSLGNCSGEASAGSLELAYDAPTTQTVTGSLPGVNLNGTTNGYSCSRYCEFQLSAGEATSLLLWFDTSIQDGTMVPVPRGILLFAPTNAKPMRMSCVVAGSTASLGIPGEVTRAQLNLSAPKSCPGTPIAGSLGVGLPP